MVGPGEVDADLEPEIKEECSGKYGDVNKVVIFEIPGAPAHEAVRIFVEFGRVEAAIKGNVRDDLSLPSRSHTLNELVIQRNEPMFFCFSAYRSERSIFWWPRSASVILRRGQI